MPDQPNRSTYIRETQKTSGSTIAFIVGGLVVAVAVVAWFVLGGDIASTTGAADSTTTNVTIQPAPDAPAAEVPAPEAVAPAPEAVAPAPAPAGN